MAMNGWVGGAAWGRTLEGWQYAATDAVSYDWVDISQTGTQVVSDNYSSFIPIGFDFSLYGQSMQNLYVTNNGVLSVDPGNAGWDSSPIIAPYSASLQRSENPGSGVYYKTMGDAGSRQFVVQWEDMQRAGGSNVTFQAIMSEGSNAIKFQYKEIGTQNVFESEVGIKGLNGLSRPSLLKWSNYYETGTLGNNTAIQYDTVTVPPPSGHVSLSNSSSPLIDAFCNARVHLEWEELSPDPNNPYPITRMRDDSQPGSNGGAGAHISEYINGSYVDVDAMAMARGTLEATGDGSSVFLTGSSEVWTSTYAPQGPGYWSSAEAMANLRMEYHNSIMFMPDQPGGSAGLSEYSYDANGRRTLMNRGFLTDHNPYQIDYTYFGGGNSGFNNFWYEYAVPEPMTLSLLAIGGLALLRRRKS